MNKLFTVKFWGVRGSHPVPGSQTLQYGGNTPCVEVNAGGQTIILDAGTGIINLGKDLLRRERADGKNIQAAILFSHLHHDHTQGFPFFTPAYLPGVRLYLGASSAQSPSLEAVLGQMMHSPVFPVRLHEMASEKRFYNLEDQSVMWLSDQVDGLQVCRAGEQPPVGSVVIRSLRSNAHPGGVVVYRIEYAGKVVVYATDTEGYVDGDRKLAKFAQGADLLIHDAQYTDEHYSGQAAGLPTTQGWGHSTGRMAAELALHARVGKLVLFHHDPAYDDRAVKMHEARTQRLFPNCQAAYEGLELNIPLLQTARPENELKYIRQSQYPAGHSGVTA